jgi:alkanesulfonate monooxygenase SsuD/methylene tetrahydromethanopterin reductase-like flavin-dependent oxidoreductase (luciferase family)
VARLGDGWLASAYNTTPGAFAAARRKLAERLHAAGKDPKRFPNAIATMFFHVTEARASSERIVREVLSPRLKRPEEELRRRLLVGPAEECARKLADYRAAGAQGSSYGRWKTSWASSSGLSGASRPVGR